MTTLARGSLVFCSLLAFAAPWANAQQPPPLPAGVGIALDVQRGRVTIGGVKRRSCGHRRANWTACRPCGQSGARRR